ncbi:MAG: sugar phosphate isomerase/epimerase [Acidimicrobiales bacterium]|nr:sugar phosphate isomerase/epimerase [Acidimicrobiales bacterium]
MTTARKPRDLGHDDLVLCHFTLDRHHDIEQRVRAAAAGGYAAIGIYTRDYQRLEADGRAPDRLAELLESHGVGLAEIEALRGWGDPAVVGTDDYLEQEATAWRIADRFESRYVQAIGPYAGSMDDAGQAFGALCDRAAEHGLVVGLEFLPFTNIVDASDALAIVEAAARPNGGVCLDIWHHERGAADLELLRAVPGELITGVQVSDGPAIPVLDSYYDDCLRTRLPPGQGDFDVAGFVEVVEASGTTAPWGVEVCNQAAWATDGIEHAQACADGLRAFLQN